MIGFKDEIPLIQEDDGRVVEFDRKWLARSLLVAAELAGHPRWWPAPHVAESVERYMKYDCDGSVVELDALADAVRNVLKTIGYPEIADRFEPLPFPKKLSLSEIADEAGSGYELMFFSLLRQHLRAALDERPEHIEMYGLCRCVKKIDSAKIWRRRCNRLRNEIVTFIRRELDSSRHTPNLSLTLQ